MLRVKSWRVCGGERHEWQTCAAPRAGPQRPRYPALTSKALRGQRAGSIARLRWHGPHSRPWNSRWFPAPARQHGGNHGQCRRPEKTPRSPWGLPQFVDRARVPPVTDSRSNALNTIDCASARVLQGSDNATEPRPCSRTLRYFPPVHERGTKWDDSDGNIRTIIRPRQLNDFMSLVRRRVACRASLGSPAHS